MKINTQLREAIGWLDQGLRLRAERVSELASTPNLSPTVEEWVESRALCDQLKALKARADALLDYLTDDRVPWQLDKHNELNGLREGAYVPHALGRVEIRHHVKASIAPDMKSDAYKWLRANDLGGLIIETIPHQTLGKTAKDMLAEGKDLPADLFTVTTRRYAAFVEEKGNAIEPSSSKAAARAGGAGASRKRSR